MRAGIFGSVGRIGIFCRRCSYPVERRVQKLPVQRTDLPAVMQGGPE